MHSVFRVSNCTLFVMITNFFLLGHKKYKVGNTDLQTKTLFSPENNTTAEDDWDSDDTSSNCDTSDSGKPECISSPHRKTLIDGNISRKQGHVIIPLNCSTEVRICQDTTAPPRDSPLADSFFQQLATIQTDTRRKLREAKSTGMIFRQIKDG